MVSYKPQAGQTKIPVAASRTAGGYRPIPTQFLGGPEKADEPAVRPAVRAQNL